MAFVSDQKGGSVVSKRNFDLVCEYFDSKNVIPYKLEYFSLSKKKSVDKILAIISALYNIINLRGNGCSKLIEDNIIELIDSACIKIVCIDGSLNGRLIRRIVRKYDLPVVVFSHNCEALLLWRCFSLINLFRLPFVFLSEYLTCRYAKRIITLSERDRYDLLKLYKRKADFDFPITVNKPMFPCVNTSNRNEYCLFVGSDFLPNNEGIVWFIEHVSPFIPIDTYIIGTCCQYIQRLGIKVISKVHLLGRVDDLQDYYYNASCVVIPIFKGSGMKTKTIEAMSYGKTIFGTSEAFIGISADYNRVGGLCNTKDDFISAISSRRYKRMNEYVYNLFCERYETNAAKRSLFEMFMNI